MSSPIVVTGSTTIIAVRARDFITTPNLGQVAIVILSSINSFGRMITIFDEDGLLGTGGRRIRISTSRNVFLDSGLVPGQPGGDFVTYLTTPRQSISLYPRTLNQWVLPQTVISSDLDTSKRGITFSGTNFNSLEAQIVAVSTNLLVYGSTISATPFTIQSRVLTSLTQDSLVVNGIQSLTTSTGSVTVGSIVVQTIGGVGYSANQLDNTSFIQASTVSSYVTTASTLTARSLGMVDGTHNTLSFFTLQSLSTFFNGIVVPKETASTFSTTLLIYSTSLPLLNVSPGISSISSFISPSVSSIAGADALSTYSTAYIGVINSLNYAPGLSSLSTLIAPGISSLILDPAVSTLSTVISRGLSTVYFAPGISSLNITFVRGVSTVASGPGLSTLSTAISLGLSTVNATFAFANVSSIYSYGISDISVHTGLSSLSTTIGTEFSSLIFSEGVSSISSYVFSSLSSLAIQSGISTLSTITANYFLRLTSPQGLSTLSTFLFSSISTYNVSPGLSSLSTVIARGLSTVSVAGGLSSISTTFALGFANVFGGDGISSFSTMVPAVLSSIITSPGASSFYQFIRNQFSTLSDQEGISSLSSVISRIISSVATGTGTFVYPAVLSTFILRTSSVNIYDSTNYAYTRLSLSANVLYIGNIPIENFVLQSTSRSTISISTLNTSIGELLNASTIFGTSLRMESVNGTSTPASTVSTISFTTSSLTTSSINFTSQSIRTLGLISSNDNLIFNGSTISEYTTPGASSLSTTIYSGISSLSNIMPMPFRIMSTAISIGVSSLNYAPGLSTLSTNIGRASTVNFFPGTSTNNFITSTALVSTISSFGPISSFLRVNNILTTSTLYASTLITSSAVINILDIPNLFISSLNFNQNSVISVSSLSTVVTGLGVSTGDITIRTLAPISTRTLNVLNQMNMSSIVVSTIFLPNFGTGPASAPLFMSSGSVWFNNNDIVTSGVTDITNFTGYMTTFSTGTLYVSTIVASSFGPSVVKAQQINTYEAAEVTQSSFSMWNRTVFSSFGTDIYDQIEYSTDGFIWQSTNWRELTRSGGDEFFTKPSYNGVYWLVGNYIDSNGGNNPGNSVLYSGNGINYYPLERNQFSTACVNPTWNGQYWLAGDLAFTSTFTPTIRRSFDGLIWTPSPAPTFYQRAYNFAWNGSMWIAVGDGSDGGDPPLPVTSNMFYGYDGLSWTACSGSSPNIAAKCVLYDGDKWVAGGQSTNSFLYSYDGINWLTGSGATDYNNVQDLKYNGRVYVASGQLNSGTCSLAYSYNGINWTYNSNILDGGVQGIDWSGEKFVATGSNATNNPLFVSTTTAYSYNGVNWFNVDQQDTYGSNTDLGQKIGFSSNVLPAVETTTLKIHTMSKGYIPLFLTSTNHWQMTPSSIIMNNRFVVNKELGSDKRVGINTVYPQCTLDVNGTFQMNNSTIISSLVIGSSINYNPNFEVTIFGSTYTQSLAINTIASVHKSASPLDVFSPGQPIINRSATFNISTLTSTLINIRNVAAFPMVSDSDTNNPNSVFWVWNNGGTNGRISSCYFALQGSAFFTGQHAVEASGVTQQNISSYVGLIVVSDDKGYVTYDVNNNKITGKDAIWSTESLPRVRLTTMDKEKSVFGVLSDLENLGRTINPNNLRSAYNTPSGFTNTLNGRLLVNGVGDGALWVTNINGNITSGDYICASVVPGNGRKQDDNCMYNYTVAKATMSCDFDLNTSNYRCEQIDFNGSSFLRAYIGVTYHCS